MLLANGDGTFQAPTGYPAGNFSEFLSLGDKDKDCKLDVVTKVYMDSNNDVNDNDSNVNHDSNDIDGNSSNNVNDELLINIG